MIIVGDLNAKHMEWNCKATNTMDRRLKKLVEKGNLLVLTPNEDTHIHQATNTRTLDGT